MGWGLWALGQQVAELGEAGIHVGVVGRVVELKAGGEGATGGRGEEGGPSGYVSCDCRGPKLLRDGLSPGLGQQPPISSPRTTRRHRPPRVR